MGVIDRGESLRAWCMRLRQIGRVQIGRILGSVPDTHGGYKALIDLLERCYFMRAEINGITGLLLAKKLITQGELEKAMDDEFARYFAEVAKGWPEIEFTDIGYTIKDTKAFAERMAREGWPQ